MFQSPSLFPSQEVDGWGYKFQPSNHVFCLSGNQPKLWSCLGTPASGHLISIQKDIHHSKDSKDLRSLCQAGSRVRVKHICLIISQRAMDFVYYINNFVYVALKIKESSLTLFSLYILTKIELKYNYKGSFTLYCKVCAALYLGSLSSYFLFPSLCVPPFIKEVYHWQLSPSVWNLTLEDQNTYLKLTTGRIFLFTCANMWRNWTEIFIGRESIHIKEFLAMHHIFNISNIRERSIYSTHFT